MFGMWEVRRVCVYIRDVGCSGGVGGGREVGIRRLFVRRL